METIAVSMPYVRSSRNAASLPGASELGQRRSQLGARVTLVPAGHRLPGRANRGDVAHGESLEPGAVVRAADRGGDRLDAGLAAHQGAVQVEGGEADDRRP